MIKIKKQLFKTIKQMDLYAYSQRGHVVTKDGSNMPFLFWPDGSPCLLANLYMLSLRNRPGRGGRQGLSRIGSKGGTIGQYASKISQLIRFLYKEKCQIYDLTDYMFSQFVSRLRQERADYNFSAKKKNEQTITSVVRVNLDFLSFVGRFYDDEDFVSPEGIIRAHQESTQISIYGGRQRKTISYWYHHTLSRGERIHSRSPVTDESAKQLRLTVNTMTSSNFVKSRRQSELSLLENTGARIAELAQLSINDVFAADRLQEPMLRLVTLKKAEGSFRVIPVTKMLLNELKSHIRGYRRTVISNTIGLKNDHGYFFVSETRGTQLGADTLGKEIYSIRKASGIEEQVCAHMFRHAFITNIFVYLKERYGLENEDDFRRMLNHDQTLMAEVKQYTGHENEDSLYPYIKPAFANVPNYVSTVSSVQLLLALKDYDRRVEDLKLKLESDRDIDSFTEDMELLKVLRDKDFEITRKE